MKQLAIQLRCCSLISACISYIGVIQMFHHWRFNCIITNDNLELNLSVVEVLHACFRVWK
jgi:hypothetical protein